MPHFGEMAAVKEQIIRLKKKSLKRVFGTVDLFSIGYGDIGSSLYYTLGATALYALGATPLALLLAGFVFVCTALTYTEMSTMFPEPGGSAAYSRHAFNDFVSFVAGWGLLLDYIVTIAISAFAVPPYLRQLLDWAGVVSVGSPWVHCSFTIAIIFFLFLLNFFGAKHSGRFTTILALFAITTQAAIVLIGALFLLNFETVFSHMKIGVQNVDWSPSGWGFAKGCAMAMVAYTGIEAIAQLSPETKQPGILVPRAIRWTTGIVLVLYVGITFVGLSVVSPQELSTTYINDPIGGIARQFPVGGEILAPWVGLLAAMILSIAANAGLIGCSRLIFSMGEYYQVPNFCYKLHSKFRTPYVTLFLFSSFAAFIVALSRGQMLFLADLYNFGAQIAFFSVHGALLVLRWKKPDMRRPYRAPLNIPVGKNRSFPLTAILGAAASLSVWILVVVTKPEGRTIGLIWMLAGVAMYLFYRKKQKISPFAQSRLVQVSVPEFRPLNVRHVLAIARCTKEAQTMQTASVFAKAYKAELTIATILEIPYSLPMETPMPRLEALAEAALKRAEAVARELHLTPNLKIVRSRSLSAALSMLAEEKSFDFVIVGADYQEMQQGDPFVKQAQRLLQSSPCRVMFCRS